MISLVDSRSRRASAPSCKIDRPRTSSDTRRQPKTLDLICEGKGTPAEEQHISALVSQLASRNMELRLNAVTELGSLVKDSRVAATVGEYIGTLTAQLNKKVDKPVQNEVLSLLRCLGENGQHEAVGRSAYIFVECLSDDDLVIARKAAMLFCVVAREGAASMIARYVPKLMECCECAKYRLIAPLEALQAIASCDEGASVAAIASRLHPILTADSERARVAACNVLLAIFQGGGGQIVCTASFMDKLLEEEDEDANIAHLEEPSLFKTLLLNIRDGEDDDVRSASAKALQRIVLFDERFIKTLKKRHGLLLFNCAGSLHGTSLQEARCIITEILGMNVSGGISAGKSADDSDDDEHEVCAVCYTSGLRCQKGGPERLGCGHSFHAFCIKEWFAWETKCGRGHTCPLCRAISVEKAVSPCAGHATSNSVPNGIDRTNFVSRLRSAVTAARMESS